MSDHPQKTGRGGSAGTLRGAGTTLLALGGLGAALGAASCCVIPIALGALGLSGAWMSVLGAFAPYRTVLLAATLVCLAAGFPILYRKPADACAVGEQCRVPTSTRIAQVGLWAASVLFVASLVIE